MALHPAYLPRPFFFLENLSGLLLGNELHGLYRINPIVIRLPDTDFPFHVSMLLTIGNTVIMLSVGSEPSDFSFQVAVAQIALCGSHLLIRKKLSFITELPGNILRIIIKNYMNLIPLIMGDSTRPV